MDLLSEPIIQVGFRELPDRQKDPHTIVWFGIVWYSIVYGII